MRDNDILIIGWLKHFKLSDHLYSQPLISLSVPSLFVSFYDTLVSNSACKGGSDGLVVKEV